MVRPRDAGLTPRDPWNGLSEALAKDPCPKATAYLEGLRAKVKASKLPPPQEMTRDLKRYLHGSDQSKWSTEPRNTNDPMNPWRDDY